MCALRVRVDATVTLSSTIIATCVAQIKVQSWLEKILWDKKYDMDDYGCKGVLSIVNSDKHYTVQMVQDMNWFTDPMMSYNNMDVEYLTCVCASDGVKCNHQIVSFFKKYIELASTLDGLSPTVPLYRVSEGNEPSFFTTFFSWDSAKANAHGNSFRKKILLMFVFGGGHAAESQDRSNGNQGGPTQRASALAALNSAFQSSPTTKSSASPKAPTRGSQRAAAVAALSSVLTAEKKGPSDASPVRPVRSPPSVSSYLAYLSADEFEAVLGVTKEAFYKIPKWKQDMMKKKVDLF
ncbi:Gelsolin domain-containing protein [Artemisia annua]|uniref:Gelsolin domain-containing protein n=1 Tax=Artemisia annua TaxID=35608 RepID=A0A2U1Q2Y9_ARTAN|nr:Gelsolin domain-containing protein [Artemisia annua]